MGGNDNEGRERVFGGERLENRVPLQPLRRTLKDDRKFAAEQTSLPLICTRMRSTGQVSGIITVIALFPVACTAFLTPSVPALSSLSKQCTASASTRPAVKVFACARALLYPLLTSRAHVLASRCSGSCLETQWKRSRRSERSGR